MMNRIVHKYSCRSNNLWLLKYGMLYARTWVLDIVRAIRTSFVMRQEDIKEVISILMNSPLYLTLSVRERYGLVLRLIHDYPLLAGGADTNLEGSVRQEDCPPITH